MNSDVLPSETKSADIHGDSHAGPELLGFVECFLKLSGAAVETHESGLDVLIPRDLQSVLETPEYIRIALSDKKTNDHQAHYEINYGSPLLDRMIGAALDKIPLLRVCFEFDYVKNGGFDRLIADQLTFYGALATVESFADVVVDYLLVTFRYQALSDEQKEGIVKMVFNTETKLLVPDMAGLIESAGCRTVFMPPAASQNNHILSPDFEYIYAIAKQMVPENLKAFQESMNRRFKRDVKNLSEYYANLDAEMHKSLENPTLSDNGRKDRQHKIDALPAEFKRKTDDLFKKYSIKVDMLPAAAMAIRCPAKKIICKLSVGKKNRRFFLTYNPVTRSIEPPACNRCGKNITHIHFSKDFKLLCFQCK